MSKVQSKKDRYHERFKQLIRVLEEVRDQKKKFNVHVWVRIQECGTAACAIGWATQDWWFINKGFRVDTSGWEPQYREEYSWEAIETFFGVGRKIARDLFDGYWYYSASYSRTVTIEDVLEKVQKYVNKRFGVREVST